MDISNANTMIVYNADKMGLSHDKKLLTMTHYYKLNEESIVPIYNGDYTYDWQKYLSTQMAQGGIVSTNNELMQFLQAFFRGKLFSEKHIANPVFRRIQFIPLKYDYLLD